MSVKGIIIFNGPESTCPDDLAALICRMIPHTKNVSFRTRLMQVAASASGINQAVFASMLKNERTASKPSAALNGKSPREYLVSINRAFCAVLGADFGGVAAASELVADRFNVIADGGDISELEPVAIWAQANNVPVLVVSLVANEAEFTSTLTNYYPPSAVEMNGLGHMILKTDTVYPQVAIELSEVIEAVFDIETGHNDFYNISAELTA